MTYLGLQTHGTFPAKDVGAWIHTLIRETGVPGSKLAQGIAIPEAQFNRLALGKKGTVRAQTLRSVRRLARLVEEAAKTLSAEGVKQWIREPNPQLDDVPPFLHLRSDKELDKVLALLTAIAHGFPA